MVLLFLGLLKLYLFAALSPVPVRMRVDHAPASHSEGSGVCRAVVLRFSRSCSEPVDCSELPNQQFTRRLQVPAEIVPPVDAHSSWKVEAEAPGCWSAPITITPGAQTETLVLKLWPEAQLAGALLLDRSVPDIRRLQIRVQSPPQKGIEPTISETTSDCEVKDLRWRCPIPSSPVDIRLSIDGYAPVYFWDVALAPGEGRDVGAVGLERGASLAGRVSAGRSSLSDVTVELVPESALGHSKEPPLRTSARSEKARPNERGFFQLTGLKPGGYTLLVRKPGFSVLRASGVRLREGEELVIGGTLSLDPLASLELRIDPPLDSSGKPWQARLERQVPVSRLRTIVTEGAASVAGTWRKDRLDTGAYELSILDGGGSIHYRDTVSVEPTSPPIVIALSIVPIRGRVKAGRDPIAAVLVFQSSGARVTFESDESGEFFGTLAHDGAWDIEVFPRGTKGRYLESEQVERPPGRPYAEVDVTLPGGRLKGKTVDETGREVRASVMLFHEKRLLGDVLSDEKGEFTFLGLEPGEVLVWAQAKELESERFRWQVREDEGDPLRIVLRRKLAVSGRVTSASGQPVPGALIRFFGSTFPDMREAVTGLRGEFEVVVPGQSVALDFVVLAPGFPIQVSSVAVSTENRGELLIGLGGPSGRLAIRMGGKRRSGWPSFQGLASLIPIHVLLLPPGQGEFDPATGTFHFEMQMGAYTICPPPSAAAEPCVQRFVPPGGEALFDLRSAGGS